MRVLLTGGSGLVGSSLAPLLIANSHEVVKLVRTAMPAAGTEHQATWNPEAGQIELSSAGHLDAVVHLAGETIAQRWTPQVKRRIRDSRVAGTRLLCEALARLPTPPKVLVCASATGFYGDRGDEWLDEASAAGTGFLADVCREWEAASAPVEERGIRVVRLRIGIVLSPRGGVLAKMLPVFRLGLGGRLGGGRAYWSWIAIEDLLGVIQHALANDALRGAVNVVSPQPVTNAEFTKTLGDVLCRPTIFPVPRLAVELLFGEMGREAMLASVRVRPAKLIESNFNFRFPDLPSALRHLIGGEDENAQLPTLNVQR